MEETNKNYDWLFVKPEEKAKELQKIINDLIASNNNEPNAIKKALREDVGEGVEFYEDSYLFDLISILYSDYENELRDEMFEFFESFETVTRANQIGYWTQIDTIDGVIKCAPISDVIENNERTKEDGPYNRQLSELCNEIKDLYGRQSRCHEFSIRAAILLQKVLNTKSNVVTGYPHYYVPENKYLHSWIQFKAKDKDYVLDFTRNTMIDKESYYRLLHIEDRDICSVISSDDIISDRQNFSNFFDMIDPKTYLTTRHEIVRDLDKNKHLFDNSDKDSGEAR